MEKLAVNRRKALAVLAGAAVGAVTTAALAKTASGDTAAASTSMTTGPPFVRLEGDTMTGELIIQATPDSLRLTGNCTASGSLNVGQNATIAGMLNATDIQATNSVVSRLHKSENIDATNLTAFLEKVENIDATNLTASLSKIENANVTNLTANLANLSTLTANLANLTKIIMPSPGTTPSVSPSIGVGVPQPLEALHVGGNILATGNITANGNIVAGGTKSSVFEGRKYYAPEIEGKALYFSFKSARARVCFKAIELASKLLGLEVQDKAQKRN